MGFDIGWEVAGARALTDDDLDAIAIHVAKWASQIIEYDLCVARTRQPEIQAFYTVRPRTHEPGEDAGHGYNHGAMLDVFDALAELQRLLPDFEVRVEDDFAAYEWDGDEFVQIHERGILSNPRFDEAQWTLASKRAAPPPTTALRRNDLLALRAVASGSATFAECKHACDLPVSCEEATLALATCIARDAPDSPILASLLTFIGFAPRPALWSVLALAGDAGNGDAIDALTRCQSEEGARLLLAGGPRARRIGTLMLGGIVAEWAGEELEKVTPDDPEMALVVAFARADRELLRDPNHPRLAAALTKLAAVIAATPFCAEVEREAQAVLEALKREQVLPEDVVYDVLVDLRRCVAAGPSKLWEGRFIDPAQRASIVAQRDELLARAAAVFGAEAPPAPPAPPVPDVIDERLERAVQERFVGERDCRAWTDEARRPEAIGRVVATWLRAIEDPAMPDADATRYFAPLAAEPAMFDAVLSILRTPPVDAEGRVSRETTAALYMLRRAEARPDDVAAVLLARLRRDSNAVWRDRIVDTLADCDAEAARAARLLDLHAGARLRSAHAQALARLPNALPLLRRTRDMPFGATYAVEVLYKLDRPSGEPERRALLEHPFWLVRWRAAMAAVYSERDADLAAVWRTLKNAETSLDARGIEDFERAKASPSRELAPLPPAVAGLTSTCADHRRWALHFVDERHRASDAPTLVLADELDEALALEGYPRVHARWTLWRDVPADPVARGAWARGFEIEDATLRDVAAHGASVVAKRFPPPRLLLSPEDLERAERQVRDAEERGRQLLRLP